MDRGNVGRERERECGRERERECGREGGYARVSTSFSVAELFSVTRCPMTYGI